MISRVAEARKLPGGLEYVATDHIGRPLCLLKGVRLAEWSGGPGIPLFTALLAIDATRYSDEEITALAARLAQSQIGYLRAWGPGCGRVDFLFDTEFIDAEQRGEQRPFLMTSSSEDADESLAEAVWYAIYVAWSDVEQDVPAVVFGSDREEWCAEIRAWLCDLDALDREVVDDDDDARGDETLWRRVIDVAGRWLRFRRS